MLEWSGAERRKVVLWIRDHHDKGPVHLLLPVSFDRSDYSFCGNHSFYIIEAAHINYFSFLFIADVHGKN